MTDVGIGQVQWLTTMSVLLKNLRHVNLLPCSFIHSFVHTCGMNGLQSRVSNWLNPGLQGKVQIIVCGSVAMPRSSFAVKVATALPYLSHVGRAEGSAGRREFMSLICIVAKGILLQHLHLAVPFSLKPGRIFLQAFRVDSPGCQLGEAGVDESVLKSSALEAHLRMPVW